MKRHEVVALMRNVNGEYTKNLSLKCRIVLALYDGNYDQKRNINLEDDMENISDESLNVYGIFTPSSKPLQFLGRKYILFIDEISVFDSPESLREFYDDYCIKYMPSGVVPDEFAFKFDVMSFEDYERFSGMLNDLNKYLYPLYSFTNLISDQGMDNLYQDVEKMFGDHYEIFQYDSSVHKGLLSFYKNSDVKEESYKNELLKRLDALAMELLNRNGKKRVMIFVSYSYSTSEEEGILALMLAYLNFKYGFPIHCNSTLQNVVVKDLCSFYFPDELGTLYDKISVLKNYQNIGLMRKEFCEYLVYISDEGRSVKSEIMYLNDGVLCVDNLDLLELEFEDRYDDIKFYDDLKLLEASIEYKTFLHAGNSVFVVLPSGKGVTAHVSELNVVFPGIMIPSEESFSPYSGVITLESVRQMMPIRGCYFHSLGEGLNFFELFKLKLNALNKQGSISIKGKLRTVPFVPELFRSGEAFVHCYLYQFVTEKYQFDSNCERIKGLCSYQNVAFRNHLVHDLISVIPLERLRAEPYLTIYGTDFTQLRVSEDFFKTSK